jgi:hypothetical protein
MGMDEKAKRERVREIVRDQDGIRSEIELLKARSHALDAELNKLLKAAPPLPKTGGPSPSVRPASNTVLTLKERILAALRENPAGIEAAALAKQVYGNDDKATRRRCEAYLFNLMNQNRVRRDETTWRWSTLPV